MIYTLQLNVLHEMTGLIALRQKPQKFKETQQTSININTIPSGVAVLFEYNTAIDDMRFKMFET